MGNWEFFYVFETALRWLLSLEMSNRSFYELLKFCIDEFSVYTLARMETSVEPFLAVELQQKGIMVSEMNLHFSSSSAVLEFS